MEGVFLLLLLSDFAGSGFFLLLVCFVDEEPVSTRGPDTSGPLMRGEVPTPFATLPLATLPFLCADQRLPATFDLEYKLTATSPPALLSLPWLLWLPPPETTRQE